jgi:hypothetical protein
MSEVPEDQIRGLEREADEMQEGLENLGEDLQTAHEKADQQRERANPEAVAGDWQDESAGAQQGDDARDAEGAEGPGGESPGGEGGGGSIADAPVHEARKVEPGEGD